MILQILKLNIESNYIVYALENCSRGLQMTHDLSKTNIMTFEIGNKCNLSKFHFQCPINIRKYKKMKQILTPDIITNIISEASYLNFNGFIAFHFYNEPLLEKEKILDIILRRPNQKYLLWTNGLLLDRTIKNNKFINLFSKVIITCYFENQKPFFYNMQKAYPQIHLIERYELDDRLQSYYRNHTNIWGCKKPLFELPIDYYGNVILCCYDWNNSYEIGNVIDESLVTVVNSERYQAILRNTNLRLMDKFKYPHVCNNCNKPMLLYQEMV